MEKQYRSFEEFWPFYLSQHRNYVCRALHLFGTSAALLLFVYFLATQRFSLLILAPLCGYLFAWIGHFIFEKNRPATFTYPKWSFQGDVRLIKLFYSGKLGSELQRLHIS